MDSRVPALHGVVETGIERFEGDQQIPGGQLRVLVVHVVDRALLEADRAGRAGGAHRRAAQ